MNVLLTLLRLLKALARELSDEGAYDRYLASSGRVHSQAEWRRFIDGRHRRKYRNGKCC